MQLSQLPTKLTAPFASGAGASYIRQVPVPSQQGVGNGAAASWTDGFPPICFLPTTSGGIPPAGQDINGVLNAISAWVRWTSAGGTVPFDSAFANAIGGYPQGAIVQSSTDGLLWLSTADNNTTNPDSPSAANWISIYTSAYAVNESTMVFKSALQTLPAAQTETDVTWDVPGVLPSWGTFDGTTWTATKTCRVLSLISLTCGVSCSGPGYAEADVHINVNGADTQATGQSAWPNTATTYLPYLKLTTVLNLSPGNKFKARAIANAASYSSASVLGNSGAYGVSDQSTNWQLIRLS